MAAGFHGPVQRVAMLAFDGMSPFHLSVACLVLGSSAAEALRHHFRERLRTSPAQHRALFAGGAARRADVVPRRLEVPPCQGSVSGQ